MKMMINGIAGYARMSHTKNEAVKAVDMGITMVATLFIAVTFMLVRG